MSNPALDALRLRIRTKVYPAFEWVTYVDAPFTPLQCPLSTATVALITTCGIFELGHHTPFDYFNSLGDPSFREIHIDAPTDNLAISHAHYDHEQISNDPGVALPILEFTRLADNGTIGKLYPFAYSFMGYLPETRQLTERTAPQVARRLAGEGVHAALLTPC